MLRIEIVPLILFNLLIGMLVGSINLSAHIGGLVSAILLSNMVGVESKSTKETRINGLILTLIFTSFLIYMVYFR
jgi:membrane associated rhomboid family serine protease